MFAPNRTKEFFNSMAQPTKIHGRPTYLQIKKLEKELIQYATNITTDLGGGAHGYLGLVKTDNEYNRITGTNFVIPVRPPDLQIARVLQVMSPLEYSKNIIGKWRIVENIWRYLKHWAA